MKHKLIRKHTGKEFDCLNEILDFIEIKESTIPNAGVGVFAKEDIPNNILLTWYKGFPVAQAINSSYAWNFKSDIDQRSIKIEADLCRCSNPLAFINTFANDEEHKLLNLDTISINNRLYYKTIKKIKKGEELIIDYKNPKIFSLKPEKK